MSAITKEDAKLSKWDIVDYLDSEEAIAAYFEAVAEDNDPEYMVKAINNIARARGVNELAQKMGVTREGLYKSLNGTTKPRFETICKALNALGFQFFSIIETSEQSSTCSCHKLKLPLISTLPRRQHLQAG